MTIGHSVAQGTGFLGTRSLGTGLHGHSVARHSVAASENLLVARWNTQGLKVEQPCEKEYKYGMKEKWTSNEVCATMEYRRNRHRRRAERNQGNNKFRFTQYVWNMDHERKKKVGKEQEKQGKHGKYRLSMKSTGNIQILDKK